MSVLLLILGKARQKCYIYVCNRSMILVNNFFDRRERLKQHMTI